MLIGPIIDILLIDICQPEPRRRHFSVWRGPFTAGAPSQICLVATRNISGGGEFG